MNIIPLRAPDPHVVALLESLLRQAKAGERVRLIYPAERAGGHVQNGYSNVKDCSMAIGQLERMKALLLRSIDEAAWEMELDK